MEIENRRVLVLVGLPDEGEASWGTWPPGYVECYRIDKVLDLLKDRRRDLTGHPGKDLLGQPTEDRLFNVLAFLRHDLVAAAQQVDGLSFCLPASDITRIQAILRRGDLVALSFNVKLNKNGDFRRGQVMVSWRKPEKYLTAEQLAWLEAYCETAKLYADQTRSEVETAVPVRQSQPRRVKMKAKERRREARKQNGEGF